MSLNRGPSSSNPPGSFPPGFSSPDYRPPLPPGYGRAPTGSQYTIQPGDTLWDLALRYHTTIQEILTVNPDLDPGNLIPGTTITIPATSGGTSGQQSLGEVIGHSLCPRAYIVAPGETLSAIAAKSGLPESVIAAANPRIRFDLPLASGEFICMPYRQRVPDQKAKQFEAKEEESPVEEPEQELEELEEVEQEIKPEVGPKEEKILVWKFF